MTWWQGHQHNHQPCHLNEHDELQLVAYIEYMYMVQCTQLVSIKWTQTMAGRLAVHRYTKYKQYICDDPREYLSLRATLYIIPPPPPPIVYGPP